MALVADSVAGIHVLGPEEFASIEQVLPGAAFIHGLAKLDGDLVLLYDLEQLFSMDAEVQLDSALKAIPAKPASTAGRKMGASA